MAREAGSVLRFPAPILLSVTVLVVLAGLPQLAGICAR